MHARTCVCVCMHMSNDDVSFSFPKAHGKSLQLDQHPTQNPLCIARGNSYESSLQEGRVHPKVSTLIIFRRICIPARRSSPPGCAARQDDSVGQRFALFWEILMNSSRPLLLLLFSLFSSSFHTLTGYSVLQMRG